MASEVTAAYWARKKSAQLKSGSGREEGEREVLPVASYRERSDGEERIA